MNFTDSPNFCISPFLGLRRTAYGRVAPCCMLNTNWDASDKNLKDSLNIEPWEKLRQQFMRGERAELCKRCWAEEDAGKRSQRQYYLDDYPQLKKVVESGKWKEGPAILTIDLSNICNLACKICSSEYSIKFYAEEEFLKNLIDDYQDQINHVPKKITDISATEFESLISVSKNIQKIEFFGGEPLLNKSHIKFLNGLIKNKKSKTIDLFYSSNGTITPTAEIIEVWSHFRSLKISLSIDGIGSYYSYLRWPGDFNLVIKNIRIYKKVVKEILQQQGVHFDLHSAPTASNLNIYYLPEIYNWLKTNTDCCTINILNDPNHFTIWNLPTDVKKTIQEKYERLNVAGDLNYIINYMWGQETSSDLWQKFVVTTCRQDIYRKSKLEFEMPEYWKILEKHYNP